VTEQEPPLARRPQSAPSPADLAERDEYATLTAGSADAVRGSAKTWETALTAFITLITAGVIIKGRDSTDGLALAWRIPIVALAGGGLLLAVAGLWLTVAAEAGTRPVSRTLQDIRAAHGTLSAYQAYLAIRAAQRLRWGIRLAAAAMTLLIAGVIVTWLVPGPTARSSFVIITHGNSVSCGTPEPAPAGQVRLSAPDESTPTVIPVQQITAITLAPSCP
jgi:hypothetical protein